MTIPQPLANATSWGRTPATGTYEALVSQHIHVLRRWVSSKMQNPSDAEDVVQQTLLLALRHFDQFRYEAGFGTWLCRIAINEIRGRIRRPDNWRTVFVDTQVFATWGVRDPGRSPLAELERKEANERLHDAITELPELYRSVVELRDLGGLTIRETAKSLRLTTPAIKSRLLRARTMLRKSYSERERRLPKRGREFSSAG
jgi:RNA polymerase sigma-70 factor (ECF subfamily)